MPRLLRIRFVDIGNKKARMDDLEIDLRGEDNSGTDTLIWLDNGFGKTTLVNLFFSMIRPNAREFAGAQLDKRRLEDYIGPNDHSVVAAEWLLDEGAPDDKLFGDSPRRVTGVFIERASSSDGETLRRLFFTFRVVPGREAFTLDGLPLYGEEGGRRHRLTLAGFRRKMAEADKACPAAEWVETQTQKDWLKQLDAVGLDPELFQYQIEMNRREGTADELLKFRDSDEFVDFFLQMVLDPNLGTQVADAIETYRKELYDRREKYIPEQSLVEGLITRFRDLRDVAKERAGLDARTARAGAELAALRRFVQTAIINLRADAEEWRKIALEAGRKAQRLEDEARRRRLQRAGIQLHYAQSEHDRTKNAHQQARAALAAAQRTQQLWRAAVSLAEALRVEYRASALQKEIRTAIKSAQPRYDAACEAGRQYAAALLYERDALKQQLRDLEARIGEYEKAAETQRKIAEEQNSIAAMARGDLNAARHRLDEAGREIRRLIRLGVMTEGEEIVGARRRLEIRLRELQERRMEQERKLPLLIEKATELATVLQSALEEADHAARTHEDEGAQLRRAENEKKELESSPRLLECLELPEGGLDLDVMPAETHARLHSDIEAAEQRTYQAHVRRVQGMRAVDHLERERLLPPSVEVESVIAALRDSVSMAISGWEWAAQSLSLSRGEQRSFIERAPALATGVVVRDEDFERACEILRKARLDLDAPVVVVSQGMIDSATPVGFVIGPTTDALFDRGAGIDELERRQRLITNLQAEIDQLRAWTNEVRKLDWRLKDFRDRYPVGWFRAQRERVERAGEWARKQRGRAEEAERNAQAAAREAEEARAQLEEIARELGDTQRHLEHLQGHIERFGESGAPLREKIRELEDRIDRANAAQQEAREKAAGLLAQAHEARSAIEPIAQRIGEVNACRRDIDFLPEGEIEPAPGDITTLGDLFRYHRGIYKEEVNEEGRRQLLESALQEAKERRGRFEELLPHDADEAEVLDLMKAHSVSVNVPREAERARDTFENTMDAPRDAVRQAEQELKVAENNLETARKEARTLNVAPIEPDDSIDDVSAWLEGEQAEIDALQQGVYSHNEDRQRADEQAQQTEREAASYEKDESTIAALQGGHGLDATAAVPEGWTEPESSDDVTKRLNVLRRELGDVKEKMGRLDGQREKIVEAIKRWIDDERFADIATNHMMVRNLRARSPEACERDAAILLDELEHRLEKLKEVIADVDRHRETLSEQLLQAAERGLQALQAAERQSVLPAHMPTFGGKAFLRISLKPPVDTDARRERMATLIDELARDGRIPVGLELLQQAVRRLAQPIRVDVLFPDPVRRSDYRPVEQLGVDSGGEKLTCAVLLYCTLARMRARNRGQRVARSGVLILDNPLGTASRGSFIDLQRAVAAAAGIQLVYTTGIKDYDAIAHFPKVNRLRPSGIDRTTGEFIIDREGVMTGLEMAQLYRATEEVAAGV